MFLLANLRARAAPSAPAFHTCAGTVNSLGRLTTARWFDWRLTGRAWNLTNANTWSTDQLTSGKSPPVILRTSWKGRGEGCRINTVLMTLISTYGYQCRLRSLLSSSNQQPSDHTPLVLTSLLYNYVLLSSLATVQLRAAVISDLSLTTRHSQHIFVFNLSLASRLRQRAAVSNMPRLDSSLHPLPCRHLCPRGLESSSCVVYTQFTTDNWPGRRSMDRPPKVSYLQITMKAEK